MKPTRRLTEHDRAAAKAYAARNASDPFAYARALSRIANGLFTAEDLNGGAAL